MRIVLLETVADEAQAWLAAQATVTLAVSPGPADARAAVAAGPVDAIITRGLGRITAELLDAAPGVRAVARCGVGLDNVDVAAATARGVRVLNVPGGNAQTLAEHTLALMLAAYRGLVPQAQAVREGRWSARNSYDRDELYGKTLGIVGLGHIGSRVARMAAAFGLKVLAVHPRPVSGVACVDLDTLLRESDVITLHCPLRPETRGLINAAALARMKPTALLVNTARGALIDQVALTEALRAGRIGGFAADVLDAEPPAADDPLPGLPNTLITPHIGGLTRSTYIDTCVRSVRNVVAVLRGEAPEPGCIFNSAALGRAGG